jgi:glycine cleavage system protein P-like pyridoxal-binding family
MSKEEDRKNFEKFSPQEDNIKQELSRFIDELKRIINDIKSQKKK